MEENSSFEPIIHTKLHAPRLGRGVIARQRLCEQIKYDPDVPLVLFSAPAGYGKSTAAAAYLNDLDTPYAWLSLDENDNDPRTFLRYIIAAIRSLSPDACPRTNDFLSASELPSAKSLGRQLGHELDAIEEPVGLALDDYHRIQQSYITELLSELLRYPPQGFRLVIITRSDPSLPLGSLRAASKMTEVRLQDLKFSLEETTELIRQAGLAAISDAGLLKLNKITEGWIVGLQLLIMSLQKKEKPEEFLKQLHGDIRSIENYLLDEVLDQQTPEMQQLLLRSSIFDRFCSALFLQLELSNRQADSGAAPDRGFISCLGQLELFTIRLDEDGQWYRHHHLFRDMLRRKLENTVDSSEIKSLHLRASNWFAQNDLIDEALHHALAGEQLVFAAELIEKNRVSIRNSDRWYLLDKWLALLPDNLKQKRPLILLSQAFVLSENLRFSALDSLVVQIERLLSVGEFEDAVYGELDYFRGFLTLFRNEAPSSKSYFNSALKRLPQEDYELRGSSEMLLGMARQSGGQKESAVQSLTDALGAPVELHPVSKTRLLAALIFIHIIDADLNQASTVNQQLWHIAEKNAYLHVMAWSAYLKGLIHFARNELDAAISAFEEVFQKRHFVNQRTVLDSLAGLAFSFQATGEDQKAAGILEHLREYAVSSDNPAWLSFSESCRARLQMIGSGDKQKAVFFRINKDAFVEAMLFWLETPALTESRALITQGTEVSLQEASVRLNKYLKINESSHNISKVIEILVLLAVISKKQGCDNDALLHLEHAASLAAPSTWIRPFVEAGIELKQLLHQLAEQDSFSDFGKRIFLALIDQEKQGGAKISPSLKQTSSLLIEDLTPREREVLELLSQRLRTKEIADNLFISPETVRSHLKAIYQKLAVSGRREAVAKAHEVGLLTDST